MHCRCCKTFLLSSHNAVHLNEQKALAEGIGEALRKHGGIELNSSARRSSYICKSCYLLVKGIISRINKLSSLCQNTPKKTPFITEKRRNEDRSPAQSALSPSVLSDPKRSKKSEVRVSLFPRASELEGKATKDTSDTLLDENKNKTEKSKSYAVLKESGLRNPKVIFCQILLTIIVTIINVMHVSSSCSCVRIL